ncbi:Dual adapter for phosphotyrosine and 3-phosphotyrosine and 3-phosphoinositide [Desmophyllum pertusum]|uniref:Dual adapter for phosphotyrosine and 3-phosphotyrosine and 3-phosphoinositide n=1 Tax=Desmophyllum pertusum TaxID=174260 RepID=A0A9X0CNG7_9CNID|nr:Dual adapter for phosphotyrosine and 3-phosphotyrosine and 3-phosphoinositide [Desmophyllum pertusum]
MVQVDLGKPRSKKPATVCNEPYFYEKITMVEAEETLSSMVKPGTFLVRQGATSKEFILTVRAPEGGPSFKHLPFRCDKESDGVLVAQFGSMEDSMNFKSMSELVSHFQVTPIKFEEDSSDVVLTHPWNKSEV